jgi:hypothetical protein
MTKEFSTIKQAINSIRTEFDMVARAEKQNKEQEKIDSEKRTIENKKIIEDSGVVKLFEEIRDSGLIRYSNEPFTEQILVSESQKFIENGKLKTIEAKYKEGKHFDFTPAHIERGIECRNISLIFNAEQVDNHYHYNRVTLYILDNKEVGAIEYPDSPNLEYEYSTKIGDQIPHDIEKRITNMSEYVTNTINKVLIK